MELDELGIDIEAQNCLDQIQQESWTSADYDPSQGMTGEELHNFCKFLYSQIQSKDEEISRLTANIKELTDEVRLSRLQQQTYNDENKAVSASHSQKLDVVLQQLQETRQELTDTKRKLKTAETLLADAKEKNRQLEAEREKDAKERKDLENDIALLRSDLYSGTKSQQSGRSAEEVGANDGRDDFDGTDASLPEANRKDEALFRDGEKLFLKRTVIDDRPLCQGSHFIEKIFRHDDRAPDLGSTVRKELAEQLATLGIARHDLGGLEFGVVGIGTGERNRFRRVETVAARDAAGFEAEKLDRDNINTIESGEMLDRTHEGYRRLAIGELISHDLRDREILDGGVKSALETFRKHDARTDAFKHKLFVLAVIDTLEIAHVTRDAQRIHLLDESRCGGAVGGNADAHRDQLLREGFIRTLFTHIREMDGEAARRTVGRGNRTLGEESSVLEMLFNAGSESFRQLFEGLRREFFSLEFNEQIRHFLLFLHSHYSADLASIGKPRRSRES